MASSHILPISCTVFGLSPLEEEVLQLAMKNQGFNGSIRSACTKSFEALSSLGTSCETIAHLLQGLIIFPTHHQNFSVVNDVHQQHSCPFDGCQEKERFGYRVTNKRTQESFSFTDLQIHLIGCHAFFGHLTPATICQTLEIRPGEYPTRTMSFLYRQMLFPRGELEEKIRRIALKIVDITEETSLYLGVPFKKKEDEPKGEYYHVCYGQKGPDITGFAYNLSPTHQLCLDDVSAKGQHAVYTAKHVRYSFLDSRD